mmetsp:Transcript_23963/g.36936  ORF Transcript_23963/g.36936 Transcript_23963/m.36936 type:complete len:192 (+) Transcript_23963:27-602(+)
MTVLPMRLPLLMNRKVGMGLKESHRSIKNAQCRLMSFGNYRNPSFRRFTTNGGASSKDPKGGREQQMTFLQKWMAPKEMPPRYTPQWYGEMILICTVFAITGTSTMVVVRPATSNVLGLKGSLKDGPWSYRICSIVIMTPIYATLLVVVGTVFGRHAYFRHFSVKMFSRFGIPPEMMDKNFHETKKTFRKW